MTTPKPVATQKKTNRYLVALTYLWMVPLVFALLSLISEISSSARGNTVVPFSPVLFGLSFVLLVIWLAVMAVLRAFNRA